MTATLTPSPQTPAACTAGVPILFTPPALSYSRSNALTVTSGSTVLTLASFASCLSWPLGTWAAKPFTRRSVLSTVPPYFSMIRWACFPGGPWNVTMTFACSTTGRLAPDAPAGDRSAMTSAMSTHTSPARRGPADRDMDRSPSGPDEDVRGTQRTPLRGQRQEDSARLGAAMHRPIVMAPRTMPGLSHEPARPASAAPVAPRP